MIDSILNLLPEEINFALILLTVYTTASLVFYAVGGYVLVVVCDKFIEKTTGDNKETHINTINLIKDWTFKVVGIAMLFQFSLTFLIVLSAYIVYEV